MRVKVVLYRAWRAVGLAALVAIATGVALGRSIDNAARTIGRH